MTGDTFRHLLRTVPFRPFRVVMSDGESYDVMHPEMALATAATLILSYPVSSREEATRLVFCAHSHIDHLEEFIARPMAT